MISRTISLPEGELQIIVHEPDTSRLSADELWAIRLRFPARADAGLRCDRYSQNSGWRCVRLQLHYGRCRYRDSERHETDPFWVNE